MLGEIERDKQPPRASVELEEIAPLRLLLLSIVAILGRGERMTKETYELIEGEVKSGTRSAWWSCSMTGKREAASLNQRWRNTLRSSVR